MARWLFRRIVAGIFVLWAVSSIIFLVTNVFTDPAAVSLPLGASTSSATNAARSSASTVR